MQLSQLYIHTDVPYAHGESYNTLVKVCALDDLVLYNNTSHIFIVISKLFNERYVITV